MLVSVVLAAGKGQRMRSRLPKALHPLLGSPLLEHVLETVAGLEVDRQVVVIGHGGDEVRSAFAKRSRERVEWAVQEPQLGTAHAAHVGIEAVAAALDGDDGVIGETEVIVLNGDLPLLRVDTLRGLLERHRSLETPGDARPAVGGADVSLLTCELDDPTGYGRIVRGAGDRLERIVEEKDADEKTRRLREINVGTYVFRLDCFREFYQRIDRDNAQGELYLTDVVVEAAAAGRRVTTYAVTDVAEIAQVNSRSELARAGALLRHRLLEDHMAAGVTIDAPETTYIEPGVRIGADSRILPFTVIRRGVEIGEGCEVGPFAHLRPGTRLADGASVGNFVEIKKTEVGAGSKVRHLSYLGDGIVGKNVNIGAGTIFANYDGKNKHTTEVKDGAFIGSGTVLVAPVVVGARAATGAGAVVLKGDDVADDEVVVGVPARALRKRQEPPLE